MAYWGRRGPGVEVVTKLQRQNDAQRCLHRKQWLLPRETAHPVHLTRETPSCTFLFSKSLFFPIVNIQFSAAPCCKSEWRGKCTVNPLLSYLGLCIAFKKQYKKSN